MVKGRQVWQMVLIVSMCLSSFPVMSVAPASAQTATVATPWPLSITGS